MKKTSILCKCLSLGLISVMSVGLFSGCGAKETASNSTTSNGKVEIEFFQQKPEAVDTYNEIIAKFEKQNPNIKVVQNNVPDPGTVLQTRMSSGDIPDVFSAYPEAAEFKEEVKQGYMLDLTGQKALDNVNSNILNSIKIDSKSYSLPISLNTIGIFYNKDIFNKLGISIPKTYSDLIDAAKKIKAASITPFALSDKDNWTVGIEANELTGMMMGKSKADKFFQDVIDGKQSTANNAELSKVADKLIELRQYGPDDASAISVDQAVSNFATGKAAMLYSGIWENPSIAKANPNLQYSMFPMPADKEENTKVIYGIDSAVSISAKTKHKAEALKFVEFLSKTETAQLYADKDKSPSVIKGVKINFEPIQSLTSLLNKNKSFEWLHFKWPAGMETQWNTEAQNLVISKDKNAYFKGLDKDFTESKGK